MVLKRTVLAVAGAVAGAARMVFECKGCGVSV
jgi:hypothetical protein